MVPRQTRVTRPDKYSHRIEYEMAGARTVKHAKLPIFRWVSEWVSLLRSSVQEMLAHLKRFLELSLLLSGWECFYLFILAGTVDKSCGVELTLTDVILWQSGWRRQEGAPIHQRDKRLGCWTPVEWCLVWPGREEKNVLPVNQHKNVWKCFCDCVQE